MGSNSDWPILEPAEKTLKEFGVEVEVIVASAHRTPDVVHEFAAGARNRGVEAIIAAAGAAAGAAFLGAAAGAAAPVSSTVTSYTLPLTVIV